MDDPRLADFVAQLAPVNALADAAPGFVWRLQSSSGNATDLAYTGVAYTDDPRVIVNMSVWESIAALRDFTYAGDHMRAFRERGKWFENGRNIASGGCRQGTSPRWPKAGSGWNTITRMAPRRSRFRSHRVFRLEPERKQTSEPSPEFAEEIFCMKHLCLLLIACAACMAQTPQPVQVPEGIALEANIAYDRFPDTRLDVMYPKATSREMRPGVVMFHGGGWIRSTKETMMDAFCRPFLERGFVVANVEYRLAPAATAPAAVNDALTAAKWFLDHADQYNVDRARIVVTGASAGGHLALMVGMTPAGAGLGPVIPIAAIVNGYGVADVADLLDGAHRQSFAVQWLPEQDGRMDLAKRLSPLTYVRKGIPPTLTVQGENDHTVPHEQGVRLTAALKQAGADAEMMTVPGAGHGFSKEQWPAVHARIFDFLAKRGILAAVQTAPASANEESAIKDVVARYVDARDRKDAKATEALFMADADQLVSSGEWRKGRDAVVKGTMASSEASGGKRTITVETVRFLTPDAAVADGRYEIAGQNGAAPRRMWSTFLMTRTRDGWRIAAIRNMLPAAAAAPPK